MSLKTLFSPCRAVRSTQIAFALALLLGCAASVQAAQPVDCSSPDVLGTSRTIDLGTQGGAAIGLKTYDHTLALADHEVVLTFDDGPFPATTGKVLDALAQQCVKATFFLIGRNAEANAGLVKREVHDGHTIGHHTYSHPDVTMRGWSDAQARADIDRGFAADRKSSGDVATTQFFRFPGFADTPTLRSWLEARNVAIFGADLWASDWNPMSADTELKLLLSRLEAQGRGMILLHDTKPQTAEMLPNFLHELKMRGYHVVALRPASGPPPAFETAPPGWSSETEATLAKIMPRLLAAHAKLTALGAKPKAVGAKDGAMPERDIPNMR